MMERPSERNVNSAGNDGGFIHGFENNGLVLVVHLAILLFQLTQIDGWNIQLLYL